MTNPSDTAGVTVMNHGHRADEQGMDLACEDGAGTALSRLRLRALRSGHPTQPTNPSGGPIRRLRASMTTPIRGSRTTATPTLLAPLAYLALLIPSAFIAYWAMFTVFATYDDSGYFINGIHLFTQGHALYNEVFTDYGPFSYELWAAIFGITGHTVTTDSGRLAVVALWLLISLTMGVSAQRLTGRLIVGVIVQILSFSVLGGLNDEPMHASDIVCLLFAATIATVAFVLPKRLRTALFILGAVVAALILTKINIGGLASIALLYAATMTVPALRRIAPLRWFTTAALVCVGPALMLSDLHHQWAQKYALLAAASAAALAITCLPIDIRFTTDIDNGGATADADTNSASNETSSADDKAWVWARWLVAGGVTCTVVVIGVMLALGSSLGAFIEQTVMLPMHQGTVFTLGISLKPEVVYWSVGAIAVAFMVRRIRTRQAMATASSASRLAGAIGRILAALGIWLSVAGVHPLNISPQDASFSLAVALAWVAAIPSAQANGSIRERFVRIFIPSLAVLQALMAYPVAGTQVGFGSLLFLICGAICFADGWNDVKTWKAAHTTSRVPASILITALVTFLTATFVMNFVVWPIERWQAIYSENPGLAIAGASDLHLPSYQDFAFESINSLLRSRCRSVITMPALLSFNLFSGLPAPSGLWAGPFWHMLSPVQQASVLKRAQATPGLCLVRDNLQADNWDANGAPPPHTPLVNYLENDFTPIARFQQYIVEVKGNRQPPSPIPLPRIVSPSNPPPLRASSSTCSVRALSEVNVTLCTNFS